MLAGEGVDFASEEEEEVEEVDVADFGVDVGEFDEGVDSDLVGVVVFLAESVDSTIRLWEMILGVKILDIWSSFGELIRKYMRFKM